VTFARVLGIAAVLALGLGLSCKRDKTTPQRTKSKVAQRTATRTPGFPMAGDPTPGPPLSEVFANATWLCVDPGASPNGEPEVVDPPLVSTEDGAYGQRVLAVKRAAFRRRVVKPGDSAPIDDDDFEDLELHRESHVILVGEARICVATPGVTRAIALDGGGHELQLRHALVGCGPGPHAPIGLVAERVPYQLGWVPATCDDPDAPARVGKLVFGEDALVHVFAGDDGLHLAIAAERGGPIVRSVADIDARAVAIACEARPAPNPI
jgi:hypothetical protein